MLHVEGQRRRVEEGVFFILVGNVEKGIVGLVEGVTEDEVAQGDAVELADVAPPVVLDENFF